MEKLVIVVGEEIPKSIDDIACIYQFPETELHPKNQIKWIDSKLKEILNYSGIVVIQTYSDYIIREINYYIMKKAINYKDVYVLDNGTEYKSDEYGIEIPSIDSVIENQNERIDNAYYNLKYGEDLNMDSKRYPWIEEGDCYELTFNFKDFRRTK